MKTNHPHRVRVGIAFVEERFGKHRNTIRRWVNNDKFPKPDYDPSGYQSWFLDVLDEWDDETYQRTNHQPQNVDAALAARQVSNGRR